MPFEIPVRHKDVEEIAEMTDAIVRNLWITQAYHDLGVRMSGYLGEEGTWLSYGAWASKTAGIDMRNDELPALVRDAYDDAKELREKLDQVNKNSWLRRLGLVKFIEKKTLLGIFENALGEISKNLGKGNGMVYAELAPVYANIIEKFAAGDLLQGAELEAFIAEQKLEGSPENIEDFKECIRNYFQAIRSADPTERAQLVCLANLRAGLHEQIRLQGPIEDALSAPVTDGLADIRHLWFVKLLMKVPGIGWLIRKIDRTFLNFEPEVEKLFEVVATKLMMTLETHDMTLHLGSDLPPPKDAPMFPPDLHKITLPALQELLSKWDKSTAPGVGTAAHNWARLPDRMNFIIALFRSRQQTPGLLAQPFTELQRNDLLAGRMPSGKP